MTDVPTPPDDVVRDRETAYAEVERRLGPWLRSGGLRVSPLGPGHSSDVDAYVVGPPDPAVLLAAGWLPLDQLLEAVGVHEQGRWAVVVDGRVVGAADIHEADPPDPVKHVHDRSRRQGAGPRELAELEALRARGHDVGDVPDRRPTARLRAAVGSVRRAARPRVVVAISGVDGAGKSTLTERLLADLASAGVPATRVWARPGMTFAVVDRLARAVKRLLGEDTAPGMRRAAAGKATAMRSRRGVLGRVWSTLILLNFGLEVARQYSRSRGVVVFDRHVADAEVTIKLIYPGRRNATWRLVRRTIPDAHVSFHLDVPTDVAVARKPDDTIGRWAVRTQLEAYDDVLDESVTRLDGQEDPDRLARVVLERLTQGPLG